MNFKCILIGATGATGSHVLKQLIKNNNCSMITSIGRRELEGELQHSKVNHIVIKSLLDLSETKKYWEDQDVFFNCIGTTKKKAGGADKFHEIEYGISNEAAKFASKGNIPHASLISASGANHTIWAKKWIHPLFYSKTMGQKEQTIVSNHEFKYTSVFKPGMLIREVNENSLSDTILKFFSLGLSVNILAKAIIKDAELVLEINRKTRNKYFEGNSFIIKSIKTNSRFI